MEHTEPWIEAGKPLADATSALIMLHGRGATAEDILSLRDHLPVQEFYVVAPQASHNTWYPYSFLAPPVQNEPWLTSALDILKKRVAQIEAGGIPSSQIYLLGFSQGACLTLEFAARYARNWGGVIALTGGLIGDRLYLERYSGDFAGSPIMMTNSDNDPHVPLLRSQQSKEQLATMGAKVELTVYPGRPHTVTADELARAAVLLKKRGDA